MLNQFTTWLGALVKGWFVALWDFVSDAAVAIFTAFLSAVGTLIASIPVPDWLANGLNSLWSALPPGVVYLATACGLPAALAILGSGFAFRLLRKVFTLFQW